MNVDKPERKFQGVWIPKEIWDSRNLNLQEKVMLASINSLDDGSGCYASNGYFSEFFDLTRPRISQIINSLQSKGLIRLERKMKGREMIRLIFFDYDNIMGHKRIQVPDQGSGDDDSGLKYPFGSDEFVALWSQWKKYLKHIGNTYRSIFGEQSALGILGGYKEEEAIEMLKTAMAKNWKSFYPDSGPKDRKSIEGGRSFPDYYSKRLEDTLTPDEMMKYHQHLTSKGWTKIRPPAGGTIWKQPKEKKEVNDGNS